MQCAHIETVEIVCDNGLILINISNPAKNIQIRGSVLLNIHSSRKTPIQSRVFRPFDFLHGTAGRYLQRPQKVNESARVDTIQR